ncbi:hypothetical protein [Proteus mirabilis]|uniref:hypothetical protein n=1 Tax=Proteus mirabilis TaxID=584 RepID=UPI0034D70767
MPENTKESYENLMLQYLTALRAETAFHKTVLFVLAKKNLNQDDKEIIKRLIDSSKQREKAANTEILSNIYSEEIEKCFELFMDNI